MPRSDHEYRGSEEVLRRRRSPSGAHGQGQTNAPSGQAGSPPWRNGRRASNESRSSHGPDDQSARPRQNSAAAAMPPPSYDGHNDILGSGPYPPITNIDARVPTVNYTTSWSSRERPQSIHPPVYQVELSPQSANSSRYELTSQSDISPQTPESTYSTVSSTSLKEDSKHPALGLPSTHTPQNQPQSQDQQYQYHLPRYSTPNQHRRQSSADEEARQALLKNQARRGFEGHTEYNASRQDLPDRRYDYGVEKEEEAGGVWNHTFDDRKEEPAQHVPPSQPVQDNGAIPVHNLRPLHTLQTIHSSERQDDFRGGPRASDPPAQQIYPQAHGIPVRDTRRLHPEDAASETPQVQHYQPTSHIPQRGLDLANTQGLPIYPSTNVFKTTHSFENHQSRAEQDTQYLAQGRLFLLPTETAQPKKIPTTPQVPQIAPSQVHLRSEELSRGSLSKLSKLQPPANTSGIPALRVQPSPRSFSQPPDRRSVSQPHPQQQGLHKSPQPNLLHSSGGSSPGLLPTSSPLLQAHGRSVSHSALSSLASLTTASTQSTMGNTESKQSKRLSWFSSSKSGEVSQDTPNVIPPPSAWLLGGPTQFAYDLRPLHSGQVVSEIWNPNANLYVYLFPRENRPNASFKVPSLVISSSPVLRKLAFDELQLTTRPRARSFGGGRNLSAEDAMRFGPKTPPATPMMASQDNCTSSDGSAESMDSLRDQVRVAHLYLPLMIGSGVKDLKDIAQIEKDHLLSMRNLFALLTGQPLVATKTCPTIYSVLCNIAISLKRLRFSNADGSTYGEVASTNVASLIDHFGLADVRPSKEKILQGLILGEKLRSAELYNEAFAHAVGMYAVILPSNTPLWSDVGALTRTRIESAHRDLTKRLQTAKTRLDDFGIPSLFAGCASSTSSPASKVVRFNKWKTSFLAFRRFVLAYYREQYGHWPPRAKSKKNNFSKDGLNRLVLRALYADFCALYDFLVDREALTTRSLTPEDGMVKEDSDITTAALRTILAEYDASSPPVMPPIPFDLPRIPTMTTLNARHDSQPPEVKRKAESKKLNKNEALLLLTKSHNLDFDDKRCAFLSVFKDFEAQEAGGKSCADLADQIYGTWLLVYVVLQALPMLVVDAPGLRYSEGVEYFLAMPPRGGLPWVEGGDSKAWYGVGGAQNRQKVVALPSDVVANSVEAVYRRSHCWQRAEEWLGRPSMDGSDASTVQGNQHPSNRPTIQTPMDRPQALSPVAEDSLSALSVPRTRDRTRSADRQRRSIALPLQQLPVPPGYGIDSSRRFASSPAGSPHVSPCLPPVADDTSRPVSSYGGGSEDERGRSGPPSAEGSRRGSKTLEEILGEVEGEKERAKGERMKRKSFIGLGF